MSRHKFPLPVSPIAGERDPRYQSDCEERQGEQSVRQLECQCVRLLQRDAEMPDVHERCGQLIKEEKARAVLHKWPWITAHEIRDQAHDSYSITTIRAGECGPQTRRAKPKKEVKKAERTHRAR
jgi:hypothetical protein